MLERRRRIHTDRDHRDVWRAGRAIRGRMVVLRYSPSTAGVTRYGFVVSSAVAKKAVTRNLIKRRLRSIASQVRTAEPLNIVVYATKAAPRATFKELQQDFLHLLEQLHAPTLHRRH